VGKPPGCDSKSPVVAAGSMVLREKAVAVKLKIALAQGVK